MSMNSNEVESLKYLFDIKIWIMLIFAPSFSFSFFILTYTILQWTRSEGKFSFVFHSCNKKIEKIKKNKGWRAGGDEILHLMFFHVVRNEWEKYSAGAIVMKLFSINSHLFLPLCLNSMKILSSFYDVENYFNCCWMRGRGKKKLKKFSTEIKEIFTFIPCAS